MPWLSLAQYTRALPRRRVNSPAAASIPNGGAVKYTQSAVQRRPFTAEASVRAGFMLMPEKGASKVM